jgi:hypothetical protein
VIRAVVLREIASNKSAFRLQKSRIGTDIRATRYVVVMTGIAMQAPQQE